MHTRTAVHLTHIQICFWGELLISSDVRRTNALLTGAIALQSYHVFNTVLRCNVLPCHGCGYWGPAGCSKTLLAKAVVVESCHNLSQWCSTLM